MTELSEMAELQVTACEGNFVLVDTAATGVRAESVVEQMLERGVLLRSLKSHRGGRSLVRITIGSDSQNRRCVAGLREIFRQPRLSATL